MAEAAAEAEAATTVAALATYHVIASSRARALVTQAPAEAAYATTATNPATCRAIVLSKGSNANIPIAAHAVATTAVTRVTYPETARPPGNRAVAAAAALEAQEVAIHAESMDTCREIVQRSSRGEASCFFIKIVPSSPLFSSFFFNYGLVRVAKHTPYSKSTHAYLQSYTHAHTNSDTSTIISPT